VLAPEAELIVAEAKPLAPADITLVYPFIPAVSLSASAPDDIGAFFSDRPTFAFDLALGWFGPSSAPSGRRDVVVVIALLVLAACGGGAGAVRRSR
jgi:hypothetical protein